MGRTPPRVGLNLPYTPAAVELGRDRRSLLAAAARCPVGLENLATALGPVDATEQAAFLRDLLAPSGVLILDVHNVWTQAVNLGLPAEQLLLGYPFDLVREIHVSGGSWFRPRVGRAPLRSLSAGVDGVVASRCAERNRAMVRSCEASALRYSRSRCVPHVMPAPRRLLPSGPSPPRARSPAMARRCSTAPSAVDPTCW